MRTIGAIIVVFTGLWGAAIDVVPARSQENDTTVLPLGLAPRPIAPPSAQRSLKDSYDAIPLGERIAIQSDLLWAGNYSGPINGEYSELLVSAVRVFQRQNKTKQTGVLNPAERTALSALVKPMQDQVGWQLVYDQAIGARIGLPLKLVPNTSAAKAGSLWSSAQGQVRIETFRIVKPDASLAEVFEQQKTEPSERRVDHQALKPDSFVLIGWQGLKKFHVRGYARNGEVRGITILYDQAMEVTMDQLVAPLANSFQPFTNASIAPESATPRRKIEYGSGLVVSPVGHIVTDRLVVDACRIIVIPGIGHAERLAEDHVSDLALLRVYGAEDLVPIALAGDAPKGSDLTLIGIADPHAQAGNSAISTIATRVIYTTSVTGTVSSLSQLPAPGFSGAAAVDKGGRFFGMVGLKPIVVAGAAAEVPRASIVPAETVRSFVESNFVTPASGHGGVEHCKASVVRVICVRK